MPQFLRTYASLKFRPPSPLLRKACLIFSILCAAGEAFYWLANGSLPTLIQAVLTALYLTWGLLIYRGKPHFIYLFFLIFVLWYATETAYRASSIFVFLALFICVIHSSSLQNLGNLAVTALIAAEDYRNFGVNLFAYLPLIASICLVLPLAIRLNWEGRLAAETALNTYRERVAEANRELARELHDTVARHLSVINLNTHSGLQQNTTLGKDAALGNISVSSTKALTDIRALIQTARDSKNLAGIPQLAAADVPPLGDTLRAELNALRTKGFTVTSDIDYRAESIPEGLRPTVHKIITELSFNASKYALPGSEITLQVRPSLTGLTVKTSNPARPGKTKRKKALPGAPGTGFGLIGIEERVRRLGGTISYGTEAGQWNLILHLPIPV